MAAQAEADAAAASRGHTAGIVGGLVGLAAAGTAAGRRRSAGPPRRRVRAAELGRAECAEPTDAPSCARTTRSAPRRGRPTAPRWCRPTTASCCAVEEIGPRDAPLTVVFVHGYTLSMASWTFQRRTLAAELATANGHRPDARLVFYDQRGHGASGRGAPERSTIEQLARDLAAVLEARVPRGPVVLVGHSMGGMTIMGLAALRPELFGTRIAAAALISTSSGQLADLNFGLPELLTRVRAAVFPVAAWTMRRRPAFAERTRRLAGDLVSSVTRSLSFASADVDPALGPLRGRDDRRHPGRRDRGVLSRRSPAWTRPAPWSRCAGSPRWSSPATRTR